MELLDEVKINFDSQGLWVLNIALAVVMFGVALGITVRDFKQLFASPKVVLAGIVSQFVLLPLVTFLVVILLKPQPSIALGMFMVAACPGGNISNFMTHLARGNTALSVSLTAFSTALALIMTPFNFELYGNLYAPTATILKTVSIEPIELFKLVTIILGIPLVLGMLVRYRFESFALKMSRILKPISILVFILIVVLAFLKNTDVFKNYAHHVIWIGILHNFIALSLGYLVAKGFRLSKPEIKTITL